MKVKCCCHETRFGVFEVDGTGPACILQHARNALVRRHYPLRAFVFSSPHLITQPYHIHTQPLSHGNVDCSRDAAMSRILRRFFSLPWNGHSGPTKRPIGAQLRPFCIQESVHLQPRHADGLPAREHASPTRKVSSPSATANMMRHSNSLVAMPCVPTPNCPLLVTPPSHEDDLPSQMDARHLLYLSLALAQIPNRC